MNNTQQMLVMLLSSALRGKTPQSFNTESINWETLSEEAYAQEVHGLLYPFIKELITDPSIKQQWEKDTLTSVMTQYLHIQKINEVLNTINLAGIPVIVLKGLVLREYYPHPELRSMGDSDILIHPEDMDRVTILLDKLGYHIDHLDSKHTTFFNSYRLPIEIHKSLTFPNQFKSINNFENHIWENAVIANICGVPTKVLSTEDQLIHLFFHLAQHIIYEGFGLRQISDLIVFIETQKEKLDWSSFFKKIKICGLEQFVYAMLIVLEKLFSLEISTFPNNQSIKNSTFINELISDIMNGGNFGNKIPERIITKLQLESSNSQILKTNKSKLVHYLSLIFPTKDNLKERYSYAKSNPLLIPIAWLHRIIYSIIRRDYSMEIKKSYIIPTISTVTAFETRSKLLHWLDLK